MPDGSGWYGLLDILKSGAQEAAAVEQQYRDTYCPHDGFAYKSGPDGQLYCEFDGYRPGAAGAT
jgi:hypothetical protein